MTRRTVRIIGSMRSHTRELAGLLALGVLCFSACNVSAPLVDRFYAVGQVPPMLCKHAECSAELQTVTPMLPLAQILPADLQACGGIVSSCAGNGSSGDVGDPMRDGAAGDDAGNVLDPADAGSSTPSCGLHWELGALPLSEGAGTVQCTKLSITAARGAASALVENVDWQHADVSIAVSAPFTLELRAAMMYDVVIHLSGPITLRITHSDVLHDVRFPSEQSREATSRVELEYAKAADFMMGSIEHRFEAPVSLVRTTLSSTQLLAASVSLESVTFDAGSIEATRLDATDSDIADSLLSFGDGSFAASNLAASRILGCATLSVFSGVFTNSVVPACSSDVTRLYGTRLSGGALDGNVQTDSTSLSVVRVGLDMPTDIVMWGGGAAGLAFCARSQSLRIYQAGFSCTICDDAAFPEAMNLCTIPGGRVVPPSSQAGDAGIAADGGADAGEAVNQAANALCPKLLERENCLPPLPVRERPNNRQP